MVQLEEKIIEREKIAEGYMGELRHKIVVTLTESDCDSSDNSSHSDSDDESN